MDQRLSPDVQMQFLRPGQLEERGRKFPVVYVPFGLIEWHGRHLPLGNDALKAHAMLCKCAEIYGGVVYPPLWFHCFYPREEIVRVYGELFNNLKKTGYRVIIAISGHNMQEQTDMLNAALQPVVADGTVKAFAGWEMTLSACAESQTDHAAKWETSNMMYFYPDLVDMDKLGTGPLMPDMQPPDGIGGDDPRIHASAAVGARNAELCVKALGEKAMALLKELPPQERNFNIKEISPGSWWSI